jgi:hypothetical protein
MTLLVSILERISQQLTLQATKASLAADVIALLLTHANANDIHISERVSIRVDSQTSRVKKQEASSEEERRRRRRMDGTSKISDLIKSTMLLWGVDLDFLIMSQRSLLGRNKISTL